MFQNDLLVYWSTFVGYRGLLVGEHARGSPHADF
jgi:hypothetical protein